MIRNKYQTILLLIGLTLVIIFRSLPLLQAPLNTYGYDYGFYLYAITHPPAFTLFQALTSGWGGYNNPLLYVLHYLPLPLASVLNLSFFLITLGIGAILFYFYQRRSLWAAMAAVALFALSIAQNQAYMMFLWKNQLGLVGLILALTFLTQKRYGWFALAGLGVLLIHRTTSIVMVLTCGLYLLFEQVRMKQWKWLAAEVVAAVVTALLVWTRLHSAVTAFLQFPNRTLVEGIFLTSVNYWMSALPYLLLAIPGLYLYIKKERNALLPIFVITTTLWTLLRLPFYNRMVIYVDIGLILLSAYALAFLVRNRNGKIILTTVALVVTGYLGIRFIRDSYPLIALSDIQEIQQFVPAKSGSFVLALNGSDAPWLLGYIHNSRLAAPGLFEDGHTYEQWLQFWEGENQVAFLRSYPSPLYVYERSFPLRGEIEKCLVQVSRYFYQFNCY